METLRQVRGVTLFERRVGAGAVVVVLHGGPGAHHDYLLPGFDRLAHRRTLIYYDQRGGGRSPVPREVPVGWQEHVADLERLRQEWGQAQLALLGYSWGGLLALLYALEHQDRVSLLGLVSPAPVRRADRLAFEARFVDRAAGPAITAMRAALQASGLREHDPETFRRRSFDLSVAAYFHDPSRAHELTPFRVTGRTQQEVWQSLGDYDLLPSLPQLQGVPAVVLHGEDDPIPVETARATAQALGAAFHILPRCGHVPHVEAPDEFVRALDGFLPAGGG